MPKKLVNKHTQISDSHCGPAVLQMLLENFGVFATQEEITSAAGVQATIDEEGTRVDQLSGAVKSLAPHLSLYVKEEASLSDVKLLINEFNLPVAVEWQGIFEKGEDDEEEDFGHYSVITDINEDNKTVTIADPYRDFKDQDRLIPLKEFENRWWDTNEVDDPKSGKKQIKKDTRLLFILSPKKSNTFNNLGLREY